MYLLSILLTFLKNILVLTLVIKLNIGTMKDSSLYRSPLESEDCRLPLSWGNAIVLSLLSSTHLEKSWLVLNPRVCTQLVCTTSHGWQWSRENLDEILLLADSRQSPVLN